MQLNTSAIKNLYLLIVVLQNTHMQFNSFIILDKYWLSNDVTGPLRTTEINFPRWWQPKIEFLLSIIEMTIEISLVCYYWTVNFHRNSYFLEHDKIKTEPS